MKCKSRDADDDKNDGGSVPITTHEGGSVPITTHEGESVPITTHEGIKQYSSSYSTHS